MYDDLFEALHKFKKPYVVIQYEELCSQDDRNKFLKNKLSKIGFNDIVLKKALTVKQSKPREHYEECFKEYHVNHFKKDYHEIKGFTSYELPEG